MEIQINILKYQYDVPCTDPKGKSPLNPNLNGKLDFNELIDHPKIIGKWSFYLHLWFILDPVTVMFRPYLILMFGLRLSLYQPKLSLFICIYICLENFRLLG